METSQARRRIALLSSHLRPAPCHRLPAVAVSNCASTTDDACIFCKIIRGESLAFKLYEDEVVGAMCSKVPLISNAVMKATGCGSFNFLVNNGAAAGQVIFHTHLHIIPRKASDCLWNSESLQRRPLKLDQETHRFADLICKHLLISDESKYCQVQGSSLSAN